MPLDPVLVPPGRTGAHSPSVAPASPPHPGAPPPGAAPVVALPPSAQPAAPSGVALPGLPGHWRLPVRRV